MKRRHIAAGVAGFLVLVAAWSGVSAAKGGEPNYPDNPPAWVLRGPPRPAIAPADLAQNLPAEVEAALARGEAVELNRDISQIARELGATPSEALAVARRSEQARLSAGEEGAIQPAPDEPTRP